jgi:hypothetical protein
MIIVKGSAESEAGGSPSTEMLSEMGRYNEELVKAGVMEAGEGLLRSSSGARVRFDGNKRTVTSGPFGGDPGSLVAGFWVWKVKSRDEAIEWLRKAPFREGEVEIRQIAEAEDFGDALTPELREQDERIRRATSNA